MGVFVASNLLVGYTQYSAAWVMQRALIVIPVLITGILLTLFDFLENHKTEISNHIMVVLIIVFAYIGRHNFMQMNQSFTYFNYIQPKKYMLSDLEDTIKENEIYPTDTFNFILYTDNVLMQNPADYFIFLYPNANVYLGIYGKFPEGVDLSQPTVIYGEADITNMTPSNDIHVVEYENARYNSTGTWYKINLMN